MFLVCLRHAMCVAFSLERPRTTTPSAATLVISSRRLPTRCENSRRRRIRPSGLSGSSTPRTRGGRPREQDSRLDPRPRTCGAGPRLAEAADQKAPIQEVQNRKSQKIQAC